MRIGSLVAVAAAVFFATSAFAADRPKIIIGIVAKSQSNPVFQAAQAGAVDAGKELGDKYGVDIEIKIETPPQEDAQAQAQAVEQLGRSGAQGIAVSCSDANTLAPAIDKAVDAGAQVVCFDSDSPKSKRFAYYGTDDATCGRMIADKLAGLMNSTGNVAILAGNQAAPNLRVRAQAVRDELAAKYPNMKVIDTFYHEETAEKAAATVQREQTAHPDIQGWAMIGGWPLFTRDALKWEPGTVKVVAVDALPPELTYLQSGHVQSLLAQDCYGWGHKSVEILLEKIVKGNDPKDVKIIDPLTEVTKDTAGDWSKKWEKWLGSK